MNTVKLTLLRLCAFVLDRIDASSEHDFDYVAETACALSADDSPSTTPLPQDFYVWAAEFGAGQ